MLVCSFIGHLVEKEQIFQPSHNLFWVFLYLYLLALLDFFLCSSMTRIYDGKKKNRNTYTYIHGIYQLTVLKLILKFCVFNFFLLTFQFSFIYIIFMYSN